MAKTKKKVNKWVYEIGDKVKYLYGLYDEFIGQSGIIIERSRTHIKQYYKIQIGDFQFTVNSVALQKIEDGIEKVV